MLSLMPLSDSSNNILSRPDSSEKLERCNIFTLFPIVSLVKLFFNIFFRKPFAFSDFNFIFLLLLSQVFFSGVSVKIIDLPFLIFLVCLLSRAFGSGKMTYRSYYEHAILVSQLLCILALWQKS